jgi:hypothetical protein
MSKGQRTLVVLAALVAACGTARPAHDSLAAPGPTRDESGAVRLFELTLSQPVSAEAAALTKARGDAVALDGQIVYRGTTGGLLILEWKDEQLFERSMSYLAGAASDVAVFAGHAFVACGPAGVAVLDVTDPRVPRAVVGVDTSGGATRLHRSGDLLAVADGAAGVLLLDVSSPGQPVVAGRWLGQGYVRHVLVSGELVYVAAGRQGVVVLRHVQDRLEPVGRYDTPGQARALARAGDNLFVADGPGGLVVLQVSDPAQPELIGQFPLADMARDVAVSRTVVYVANGDDGLAVLEAGDPRSLRLVSTYEADKPVNRVLAADRALVYVGNDMDGLLVLDATDPQKLRQLYLRQDENR